MNSNRSVINTVIDFNDENMKVQDVYPMHIKNYFKGAFVIFNTFSNSHTIFFDNKNIEILIKHITSAISKGIFYNKQIIMLNELDKALKEMQEFNRIKTSFLSMASHELLNTLL